MKKRFALLTPIGKFEMWGHGHFNVKFAFMKEYPQVVEHEIFSFYADECPEYLDYQAYKTLIDMKLGQSVIHEIDRLVGRLMESES